jgi:nucleotide-binding universal stress UspA family protein
MEVTDMKRFKDILCVVENEEACKPAMERAVTLAENNQACLTVIDVVESAPASADLQSEIVRSHMQRLETLVDPYRKRIDIETKVLKGSAFMEIIREVIRNGRDLVIKIPETQDWLNRLFGSADMHLFRKCPCPVWIIKPTQPKAYSVILAAVDVDDAHPLAELESRHSLNRQIIEMASSLTLSESAELHIVSAWDVIGESLMRGAFMRTPEDEINAYVEQRRQKSIGNLDVLMGEVVSKLGQETLDYLKPRTHLVRGVARKEIPALAKRIEADLIVMGTVGRTGVPGFIMGNTAETILDQIDCSVLAIKPPGFVTPVTAKD